MALKELRKASSGRIASIFILMLAASFALWGINDVFRGGAARGVAKVGNEWISTAEYQRQYRQAIEEITRQNDGKPPTSEEIAAFDVKGQILNNTVNLRALDIMARRLGMAVHDASLKAIIQSMKAFEGIDGKFDLTTYQSQLVNIGMTPATFESQMRSDIVRSQLQDSITAGAYLPRGLIEDLILYRGELRQISYVLLDASLAGNIPPPDDKTLKAYVDAHAAKFTRPELRSFTAVLFRPKDFAGQVKVSEDDIKQSYNYDIKQYEVPEKRSLRTIAFLDEASAKAAFADIKSGKKTFEQVGKERGYADADLSFTDEAKSDISDPKVADAAFALTGPGLIEPVNGALAWTIAEVKSITPGETKPLDEVHDQIRDKLALDQAQDVIEKAVNQFQDGRAGGETMEELAKRLNLKLVHFDRVDAKGMGVDGKPQKPVPQSQQLVDAAFAAEEGMENDPDFLKDGGDFVVLVDEVQPPTIKPFDTIAKEARADYLKDEQATRLSAMASALASKYKVAGLGAAATELGKSPVALPSPLRRDQTSDVISKEVLDALFKAKKGDLIAGPAAVAGKFVVASVIAVEEPSTQERAGGVASLSPTLDQSLGVDLLEQYVGAARQNLGVKVNKQMLDNAASNAR